MLPPTTVEIIIVINTKVQNSTYKSRNYISIIDMYLSLFVLI